MGKAQMLLTGEKVPLEERRKTIETPTTIKRGTGVSGEEALYEEYERIAGYVREKYRNLIYNRPTARMAYEDMLVDENFQNLFDNVSEQAVRDFLGSLIDDNMRENIDRISKGRIRMKTGVRARGEHIVEKRVYAQTVTIMKRKQVQIRNWETGRLVGYKKLKEELEE